MTPGFDIFTATVMELVEDETTDSDNIDGFR
jgi:hypothetical protein